MDVYNEDEMDQAILRVETAKQNHPRGWVFLKELNLPANDLVAYAFMNSRAHVQRLGREDRVVIYTAGWLNGLAIGIALAETRQ